jgi:general secretion pathway protein J
MSSSRRRAALGFTLVEMLVAITLLALMGVVSWRGLDHVAGQIQRIDRDAEDAGRMLRVLSQIERDLAQRLPETMLPAPGAPRSLPLSIGISAGAGHAALEILRFAPAPDGASRAQRVVYRIAGEALERAVSTAGIGWPVAPASDVTALLPARRLALRVYAGGFWSDPGEAGVQPPAPASALEITIEDADGARYVRVLSL